MTNEQKFLMGVAAGVAAMVAAAQAARARHTIEFAGRTVIISGGSRGLGLVLARQLGAEGAKICLLARDEAELDRAGTQLMSRGVTDVMTIACDVRQRDAVQAAVRRVIDRWTGIDVLMNVAGVIQVGPLNHMTDEDFNNAMATHFWGPLHLMQAVMPAMRRRGFGRIVNISSIGGKIAVPHLAPYCASKFALTGLSDAVRAEVAHDGIRVTTVAPGLMRTGSPVNAGVKGQHEAEFAWFSIAASLPGLSISAERAAHQIIEACRHGAPALTISTQARVAEVANMLAPNAVARAMMVAVRMLPAPAGAEGNRQKRGRDSQSRWSPSVATTLGDRAAMVNNEI